MKFSVINSQGVVAVQAASTSSSLDQPSPPSPRSVDGWGELDDENLHDDIHDSDKEGWDDVDPLEEQKPPPPSLTNIQAAQKRPVVQPKQQGKCLEL